MSFIDVDDFTRRIAGFLDIVRDDDKTKMFGGSGVIVGFNLTDIDTMLVLDGTVEPMQGRHFDYFINSRSAPRPTVTFDMTGETFDGIFAGEVSVIPALATGRIKGHGNVPSALKMLLGIARAMSVYRQFRSDGGVTAN